MYILVKEV